MNYKRIAIDTSKSVSTLHDVDREERVVPRSERRRGAFLAFFEKPVPTTVVLEACGGSRRWDTKSS